MDVRRSNIPCRVSKSVPERTVKTFRPQPPAETVRTTYSSSIRSSTEVKKPSSIVSPTHTVTEVRSTSKVSAVNANSEIRRTSNRVSSVTNSISKLSTSDLNTRNSSSNKTKQIPTKPQSIQPVKKIERKVEGKTTTPPRQTAPIDPNLIACPICGRHFNQERIGLHQTICKKTSVKKRRPFDPVKHRLQGTEAEDYLKKPKRSSANSTKDKKTNWRKKHEEFITIVRAAREAQAHVAKGGKLSDLPPPPSLSTDDLIQCPHCSRKFNEGAAERHIPKCANIRSNKAVGPNKTRPAQGKLSNKNAKGRN